MLTAHCISNNNNNNNNIGSHFFLISVKMEGKKKRLTSFAVELGLTCSWLLTCLFIFVLLFEKLVKAA
jgi:hypothetical protein